MKNKLIPLLIVLICASKTTSTTPPHIVFILADDLVSLTHKQPKKTILNKKFFLGME